MIRKSITFVVFTAVSLLIVAGVAGAFPAGAQPTPSWQDKADPWVLDTLAAEGETEFLVFLEEQADVSGAYRLDSKLAKGTYVYERLTATAQRTQAPVIAQLKALGADYRSFWIANMIWVRGDGGVAAAMAQRADVAHLYANPEVPLDEPVDDGAPLPFTPDTIEWNILKVNAPDVWAEGITGQGVVIGGQDTGYDWDHPALQEMYRGWDGTTADHNYNWHDAIHSGGGTCGPDSPEPCDDYGHGTHTMGTMVGDDGGSNQIGMAPGAEWIGCRNMNVGNGTPTTYSECFQWFIAPTDANDQNPDPSKAPHVINNSWSCPVSEGCTSPDALLTVVQNTRAAGIVVVVSASNSGPSCSTVSTPAAIYDESFTVGATTSSDSIASYSSRGPVTVDGSGRLKPNISAPGSSVRSSVPGGGYGYSSGTSMAGPHVAGLVALLIAAEPDLAGDVETIETLIEQTALPLTTSQTCGGVPGSDIPNNTFGYGRMDALAAYEGLPQHELALAKTAPAVALPGDLITYTLTVTHSHAMTPTNNVVLTDTLPAGTTFITATQPFTLDGGVVRWITPTLAANAAWQVNLIVQAPPATGPVTNADYAVRSDEVNVVFGTPVTTTITDFVLEVGKEAVTDTVTAGDLLTYTLTVTNLNTISATHNVVLTDALPAGSTLITATTPFTLDGNVVRWHAAGLGPNSTWTVQVVIGVPLTYPATTLTNAVYGAASDEAPFVSGSPVIVDVLPPERLFLPVIIDQSPISNPQ